MWQILFTPWCVSFQVTELQAEVDSLKVKHTTLLRESRLTEGEKDVEVQKVFPLFYKSSGIINKID